MPIHRLKLGELNFQVLEEGAGDPVLMLHGFPDSGRLWRHQTAALVAAGYRVIAPDQRGFGETDRPATKADYHIQHSLADAVALLDAFELERVKLVSHDWGAAVGWSLAAFHPERVERHAALSVGHLTALWNAGIAQRRLAWYMLLFMREGQAEEILMRDDWQWFRELFNHHPEMDTWLADLGRPGALTAALNWYRANVDVETWTREGWVMPTVSVPTMGVWSTGDDYLTEVQMVDSGNYVEAPWRYERLTGASHWMMLDRPQAVSELLLDFFA
ncbi:MAG: alpha/beta fold hydrolase [Gammaproteobacteria bacterium]